MAIPQSQHASVMREAAELEAPKSGHSDILPERPEALILDYSASKSASQSTLIRSNVAALSALVLIGAGSPFLGRAVDKHMQKTVEHSRDTTRVRRKSVRKTSRHYVTRVELPAKQRVSSIGSLALLCRATGFNAVGVTRIEAVAAITVESSQPVEGRRLLARVGFELFDQTLLVSGPHTAG